MLLSRGSNSLSAFRPPLYGVRPLLLPKEMKDENGSDCVVYETHKVPDYGDITDYQLEMLSAAGIKPSSINTGSGSRLGASDEMRQFENIAETILTPKTVE